MDDAMLSVIVVGAVGVLLAFVLIFARPRKVLPLDELLARLHTIQADTQMTMAQKLQLAEIAYRGFESSIVSVMGGVHDVSPNGAIVIKTSSRELPLIGVELGQVTPEQLRGFSKNKPVTLRARLPAWSRYVDVVGLPAGFHEAKLYYGGSWHGVKSTYRVRDPSEPKTGEFPLSRTGEFKALPMTGPRTGEHKALPATGPRTGEHKLPTSGPKTGEFRLLPISGPRTGEFPTQRPDDPKRKS